MGSTGDNLKNDGTVREEQPEYLRTLRICYYKFIAERCERLKKDSYSFFWNNRRYEPGELPITAEKEICENLLLCRDNADGGKILRIYEDVPTFDSGDRMYDSAHKAYIKRVGNKLHALLIRNGYYLSSADVYYDIRPADEKSGQLLRDTGFSL